MRGIFKLWKLIAWALVVGGCDGEANSSTDPGDTDSGDTDVERDEAADVCHFRDEVTLGEVEEDGMVRVPANHPYIRYFGRVDCSAPDAPAFAFPGVSIRARFEGDAIDMVMDDNGNAELKNYYNVIIDNNDPEVVEMSPGEGTYALARDLADGEHTVEIFKRVESNNNVGKARFRGFRINEGATLLPLPSRPYRLEAIGDSITCGYGNELSVDVPSSDDNYTTERSNAYNAWTAIAARDLDAEYMAVAYSGRGVYRNYAGGEGETLPEMYLDTLPDDDSAAQWDVSQFTPGVLVINLGTNDFSGLEVDLGEASEDYELAMLAFVETLREYYPDAVFVLAVGPMITGSLRTSALTALEAVIAALQSEGDDEVYLLDLGMQSAPFGEDWHPTVATHMEMAGALVDFIVDLDVM